MVAVAECRLGHVDGEAAGIASGAPAARRRAAGEASPRRCPHVERATVLSGDDAAEAATGGHGDARVDRLAVDRLGECRDGRVGRGLVDVQPVGDAAVVGPKQSQLAMVSDATSMGASLGLAPGIMSSSGGQRCAPTRRRPPPRRSIRPGRPRPGRWSGGRRPGSWCWPLGEGSTHDVGVEGETGGTRAHGERCAVRITEASTAGTVKRAAISPAMRSSAAGS